MSTADNREIALAVVKTYATQPLAVATASPLNEAERDLYAAAIDVLTKHLKESK